MSNQTFGDRVLALRKTAGLSQAKLAAALKEKYPDMRVSDSAVHAWEKLGKTPVGEDMANLSEFFGVEPAYLQFGLMPLDQDEELAELFSNFVALTAIQKDIIAGAISEFAKLNAGGKRQNGNM